MWSHRVVAEERARLVADLRNGDTSGQGSTGLLWVIEYQKRGLPHVRGAVRVGPPALIDAHICTCLPRDASDQCLVEAFMMHTCTQHCKQPGGTVCQACTPKPLERHHP
jgi:hypothetical protein